MTRAYKPLRVTLDHLRQLGYCMRGVRAWCAKHGMEFEQLRTQGFLADALEETGDHLALQAVRLAREQQEAHQ